MEPSLMVQANGVISKSGPDQVCKSDRYWSTDPTEPVILRIPEDPNEVAISIPTFFETVVRNYPDHIALKYKADGKWKSLSYTDYKTMVRSMAKAFLKLGLERHHGVGILASSTHYWHIANLAAIYAGGLSTGIYLTNSPDACCHCLSLSKANICVVEDPVQLKKILSIKHRLPELKAIVLLEEESPESHDFIHKWDDLMIVGGSEEDNRLEETLSSMCVNECCSLVFTSGTEGPAKAVMIHHDNLVWASLCLAKHYNFPSGTEQLLAYLPLSHIAGQMVDIYLALAIAGTVWFAPKNALKGALLETLLEAKPTLFFGVPRVWEKIAAKIQNVISRSPSVKQSILRWASSCSLTYYLVESPRKVTSLRQRLFRTFVFDQIKGNLGMRNTKYFGTGAAPLCHEIKRFFVGLDIPLIETYGMSECTGAHTFEANLNPDLKGVGKSFDGTDTKIDNPVDGHGEICIRGRHVFMGYLGQEDKTKQALDEDGWLHTGDIGRIDENNVLHITGRIKELLITAGGENVAPLPIEEAIKRELPVVSNAVVIGDQKKFLSVLLTLKTDIDEEQGTPTDNLTTEAQSWLLEIGIQATSAKDLVSRTPEQLDEAIKEGLERANQYAVSNAQRVQTYAILPEDFSIASGEFGPTLKLRRSFVAEKYKGTIDNLYN